MASECEVIITMVPNSPHVRAAVFGEGGIAETAKPGTVLIDMSSIDPVESKKIGAELAEKGIDMLDAPVSGGEPKAIDGMLSVMVGGKKELFDKYYDLLMVMAGSVVYVGELGSGNVAKLANQIVVAVNIAAVSEALTFAKKAGTDPELVYQAIRGGLAGSTVMDAKAPMMLAGNYNPGFRIELHIKDLTNALNAAHAINYRSGNSNSRRVWKYVKKYGYYYWTGRYDGRNFGKIGSRRENGVFVYQSRWKEKRRMGAGNHRVVYCNSGICRFGNRYFCTAL